MFDGLVEKFSFPVPVPSYTAEHPLRVYTIDGYYNEITPPGKYSFHDFECNMFWAGETPCICFPHPQRANKVLVYAHANHEDMWRTSGLLQTLRDRLGVHAVGFEYPGYACAPGKANEVTSVEALRRVYRYLRDECKFAPSDVLLVGRSIGSGICCQFAAQNQVLGVALLSPFTSIKAVVQSGGGHTTLGGMAAALINDTFRSIEWIKHITHPVLILHGDQDTIVPHSHGQELHAAATLSTNKAIHIFAGMGHNDLYDDDFREDLLAKFKSFFEPLLQEDPIQSPRREFNSVSPLGCSPEDLLPGLETEPIDQETKVSSIRMVMRSIQQQDNNLGDPTETLADPEEVSALAMRTLTKLQIIFEEADVNSQRQLGPDELAILITAAYSEYCGEPDMPKEMIAKEVKDAFESYDINGNGSIEFLDIVEMFCGNTPYQLPIHPDVKLQMRLMASKGGWDGLELRFI